MSDENAKIEEQPPREEHAEGHTDAQSHEQHDAGSEAPPVMTTAPSAAPDDPPPSSDAAPAGVSEPPAVTPSGAASGADAPTPSIVESQPAPPDLKTGELIDTQEKAAETLGVESGIHPETLAAKAETELAAVEESVHSIIARIRAKLAAYGQEVHDAVARDIEALQKRL